MTITLDRPSYRLGPEADPAAKRAWRGETELSLSPKRWRCWNYSCAIPRVLSRTEIIDAIWDFAYQGGSNVVDQYVKYLRDKVDTPFGHKDIETVADGVPPSAEDPQ